MALLNRNHLVVAINVDSALRIWGHNLRLSMCGEAMYRPQKHGTHQELLPPMAEWKLHYGSLTQRAALESGTTL